MAENHDEVDTCNFICKRNNPIISPEDQVTKIVHDFLVNDISEAIQKLYQTPYDKKILPKVFDSEEDGAKPLIVFTEDNRMEIHFKTPMYVKFIDTIKKQFQKRGFDDLKVYSTNKQFGDYTRILPLKSGYYNTNHMANHVGYMSSMLYISHVSAKTPPMMLQFIDTHNEQVDEIETATLDSIFLIMDETMAAKFVPENHTPHIDAITDMRDRHSGKTPLYMNRFYVQYFVKHGAIVLESYCTKACDKECCCTMQYFVMKVPQKNQ